MRYHRCLRALRPVNIGAAQAGAVWCGIVGGITVSGTIPSHSSVLFLDTQGLKDGFSMSEPDDSPALRRRILASLKEPGDG